MSYDVCMLKGPRGRCASWPILDPASQIHPGILLGGGGNGVCISHGRQLLADIRRGDSDAYDEAGVPTDLEGQPRDGSVRNEDYRRQIERVHEVWKAASSYTYLGMRSRRVATRLSPQGRGRTRRLKVPAQGRLATQLCFGFSRCFAFSYLLGSFYDVLC